MTGSAVTWAAPNSPEWATTRREGLGASDVAALLGQNPYRSPLQLWLDKTGQAHDDAGEAAEWGHRLQPVVLGKYADEHPGVIIDTPEAGDIPSIIAHPDEPVLRCSLDALGHDAAESFPIEVKTAGARQSAAWADGGMPDAYIIQVLWQLGVTGLGVAHVAVLIGGQRYEERIIAADPVWFDAAASRALDWWDAHVVADVMPDPDPLRDAPKLARLWTPDPAASVEVDPVLIERLRDTRAAAAAARTDYAAAVAAVQAEMRQATVATVGGEPVARWSVVKPRTTVDVAALKADGIYDRYSLTGEPSRRFTVSHL